MVMRRCGSAIGGIAQQRRCGSVPLRRGLAAGDDGWWRGVATRGAGLVRRRQKSPRERAARWEFAGAKRGLRVIPRGIYNTRVEFLREFCGF